MQSSDLHWHDPPGRLTLGGSLILHHLSGALLKHHAFLLCASLFAGLVMGNAAQANAILRMLDRSGLVQQDIDIMTAEAATLYQGGGARVGDDTIWSNPATGAHGMAEITAVEGACVDIAYRFRSRSGQRPQEVVFRRCRSGDGWVLSN